MTDFDKDRQILQYRNALANHEAKINAQHRELDAARADTAAIDALFKSARHMLGHLYAVQIQQATYDCLPKGPELLEWFTKHNALKWPNPGASLLAERDALRERLAATEATYNAVYGQWADRYNKRDAAVRDALLGLRAEMENADDPDFSDYKSGVDFARERLDATLAALGLGAAELDDEIKYPAG